MDNSEETKNQTTKELNKQIEEIEKTNNELKNLANKLANEFEKQLEKMKSEEEKKGKRNNTYFYINDFGYVDDCHETNAVVDDYRYKIRNYFKTEEETEEYQEVMTTYYDLMDLAEELNKGRKIDWNNERQQKFYIYFNLEKNTLIQGYTFITKDIGQIYCLNENIIGIAIRKIGVDKLIKLFTYERN